MTTREFISKTYGTTNTRWNKTWGYDRQCSSVLTNGHGTVFSYGRHYPLLFKIGGIDFINITGYSNTTARHISHARMVAPDALEIRLWREDINNGYFDYSEEMKTKKLRAIKNAVVREMGSLSDDMDAKKRKDTQIYSSMLGRYNELVTISKIVDGLMEAK